MAGIVSEIVITADPEAIRDLNGRDRLVLHENMRIEIYTVPAWYQKVWRWFKYTVLCRPRPEPPKLRRISAIDYKNRTITYEGGEWPRGI